MQLNMKLGERRRASCRISSSIGDAFLITDPIYTLKFGGVIPEASGVPEVSGHSLLVMLEPKKTGEYELEFTFYVGGERIIKSAMVSVEK